MEGKPLALFVHHVVPDSANDTAIPKEELPLNLAADVMVSDQYPNIEAEDAWTGLGWMTAYTPPVTYKGYTMDWTECGTSPSSTSAVIPACRWFTWALR